jgi:hypothetical protein
MRLCLTSLGKVVSLALSALAVTAVPATAQLAITEVMAATRTNAATNFRGPDYWELTNFGTNAVDLSGYGFRDANPRHDINRAPFAQLVIGPGESIIFFQWDGSNKSPVTNPDQFREWWGDANLPATLRCRTYEEPGFSGWDGDAVRLFDLNDRVIDSVEFTRARLGRAFCYDIATGEFGVLSSVGVGGAFHAALAEDIGSPGITSGPVPIEIRQAPVDLTTDLGASATFQVVASGFPSPRYQWSYRGQALPEATAATLTIAQVQATDAGPYQVRVSNGLTSGESASANLTVNTSPAPAIIIRGPRDVSVFPGQTALFEVSARGVPAISYRWLLDGVVLAGQDGPRLALDNVSLGQSGHRYSVVVSNSLGSAEAWAILTVVRRPDIRFTEVMALPANEEANRHFDWFELTNFDTNTIDLTGWRFSDSLSFERAITITNTLVLRPRESVVLAERLDPRLFSLWWGPDSLPSDLQVRTYSGMGLSAFGEVLYLWNAAASDPGDFVASVSWAGTTAGVSLVCQRAFCDEDGHCLDDSTHDSVLGQDGAFQAVDNGDVGSPGYVTNPPLTLLSILKISSGLELRCKVRPGGRYRLWRTAALSVPEWVALPIQTATNNVLTLTDPALPAGMSWFYRASEVP